KRYGGLVALDGLGLRLDPGRTVALIGPNGSGKTTALRLLAGTMGPRAGRITLAGADITDEPAGARVRRGLVRTLQANAVFPGLTTLENAVVGASVRRRHGGGLRTLVATPKARAEDRETGAPALAARGAVGPAHRARAGAPETPPPGGGARDAVGPAPGADAPAETLSTAEQRLLMLASALAT